MTMVTRLKAQGRELELCVTFLKCSKIALSLTMMAGLFLIILGPRFIAWWIDPAFEAPAGQGLPILMISYLLLLPVRGVALPILMGLGKPGLPTIGVLGSRGLKLGLSTAAAHMSACAVGALRCEPEVGGGRVGDGHGAGGGLDRRRRAGVPLVDPSAYPLPRLAAGAAARAATGPRSLP